MKIRYAGAAALATLAGVLAFSGVAWAHDVVPGTPSVDCNDAYVSLVHFPAGDHLINGQGTVVVESGAEKGKVLHWSDTDTLHGTNGAVEFQTATTTDLTTGLVKITFDQVSWTADGGKVVPINISVEKTCNEAPSPTTVPPTTTPPTTQPPVIIPPKVVTQPPAPPAPPAAPQTPHVVTQPPAQAGPTLPFTGAAQTGAEVALGLGLVAIGYTLHRKARTPRRTIDA